MKARVGFGTREAPASAGLASDSLLLLLLLLILATGCARQRPVVAPTLTGGLTLRVPAQIAAGTPVTVLVERADAPDGVRVTLMALGSYGPLLYRARLQGGRAEIRLPAEDLRASGLVTLVARADAAEGHAAFTIAPGPPVGPVTPLVGPRTLIADGAHWGTAVAIPFDRYGNPLAEGFPVAFRVQRPDGTVDTLHAPVRHLLAWRRLASTTRAGQTTVAVRAGDAHGPDATLVETPGWPAALTLSASPTGLPADGRRLVTLRTAPIVDRFGNQLLDGTLVTFVAEIPGGEPRLIPAYTIDGAAEALLEAPRTPGTVTVRATLYGFESAPLRISFAPGPAVGTAPVSVEVDTARGIVIIEVGPLVAALGQFVPEGTPVQIILSGPDGEQRRLEALANDGHAQVELRLVDLAPGAYAVEAAAGAGAGRARFKVP